MITRHLADLLYHNECVIVPGLGGFIKAYNPARIIHTTHHFFPPSGSIAFNAGLSANDGLLGNYIATAENTTYREALYSISSWVEQCQIRPACARNFKMGRSTCSFHWLRSLGHLQRKSY